MFVIYDYFAQKSIVCFKPDIRRGKYKKVQVAEKEPDKKLCFSLTLSSQTSADRFRILNE